VRPHSVLLAGGELAAGLTSDVIDRRKSIFAPAETLRIAVSLDVVGPPRHAAVLRDLFWTLYSKLAAVLEGHRIVYEVSRWISSVSLSYLERKSRLITAAAGIQGHYCDECKRQLEYTRLGDLEACAAGGESRR
jgi:hypothetical protein